MVILITGATHTGKTFLAQRLLEKCNYPYFSIDHLKMGLIRSGNTHLTPMDDEELTLYLWPILREMIKTVIENRQNLIIEGCYIPFAPSLQNIFKELNQDLGIPINHNGNLEKWAKEGVLLLNSSLTVRAHQAASHAKIGWQRFTDAAIKALSDNRQNLVFLLWGNYAIAKESLIDHEKHLILKTVHPSPLSASRGFFGCHHFSKTNEYLINHNIKPIDWSL